MIFQGQKHVLLFDVTDSVYNVVDFSEFVNVFIDIKAYAVSEETIV